MSKKVKLQEYIQIQNGYAFKSNLFQNFGIPVVRITNVENGKLNLDKVVYYPEDKKLDRFIIKKNDILLSLTGDDKTLKVCMNDSDEKIYLNQRVAILRSNESLIQKYLYYSIKKYSSLILEKAKGIAQKNISVDDINSLEVPLPSIEKQKQIAKTLDKANELIELRKESITKLDALAKSIFIDMFGDPVENPMNWELNKLSEFGNCKNGLNFDSKRNECNIKCLGVGDFKNLTTIRNIELLQTISIEKKPAKEYLLQNGDIIFVRSNGSKDLVGRCIVIYPNETEVTFSGFCIRFRLSTDLILIPYLLNVLKSKSMRQNMLGRGANILNLNQQILLGLNIPFPPMELQNKFAKIIEKIEEQKSLYEKELEKLEENFQALLQKSFQE